MPRIPAELRLGRMRRLLRRLGDPQDALRIVHVAGTKGKGSTAAMIAAALSASGVRTGLFCSPHLHRLEERFRVDGGEASPEELVALVDAVRPGRRAFRRGREPPPPPRADLLRDHHRDGPAPLRQADGGRGRAGGRARRPARLDELRPAGGLGHHDDLARPHPAARHDPGGDRGREGGHPQARRHRRQRRASGERGRRSIASPRRGRRASMRDRHGLSAIECLPPERPLRGPTPCRVRRVETWRPTGDRSTCRCSAPTRRTTRPWRWRPSTPWPSAGSSSTAGDVERGWASLRLAGPRRGLRGIALGRDRRRPQRRLGRGARRDPARLLPRAASHPRLRHDPRQGPAGPAAALLPLFDRVIATRYVENPRSVPPEEVASARRRQERRNRPVRRERPWSWPGRGRPGRAHRRDRFLVPGGRVEGLPAGGARSAASGV